jgi:putative endopeptidase
MNVKSLVISGVALCALASCQQKHEGGDAQTGEKRKFIDLANMDTTIRPGDDFFMYANGGWLKNNPIPGTETRWGSFNELQEFNYKALHELLDQAAKANGKAGSAEQKVGDFYLSGMDSATIDKAGITPLKADLDRIAAITDAQGVLNEVAYEHTVGLNPLFSFYIGPDDKNVEKMLPQVFQGGLGLPDRDYYFETDDRSKKIRAAYMDHLKKMFVLAGDDEATATKNAATVFALETKLAGASMTRVEMRDPYKVYNKFDLAQLDKTTGMNWNAVAEKMEIKGQDTLLVGQPNFFKTVGGLLKSTPVEDWKTYLRWNLINENAPYLSSAIDKQNFEFYGKTLTGQQEQKPRWKRVLTSVDGSIGELLGKMYVDKNFKPEAKERMLTLVNNLQETYAERIKRVDWMSDSTKQKALAKLNSFMKKIGYPDKWKDYSNLSIVRDSYVKNMMSSANFEYKYMVSKLGKPVDKSEWGMTPPTVNAYYNPAFNEIVFPAGILRFPFFDFNADDAINYGGIGAVIGHEMTHGFDDQGAQYAADGNLKNWWSTQDEANFKKRTDMVVKQYNAYTVLDNMHVNGELTQGENIADLGGLAIAYEAFKKTKQGQSSEKIDGFTPDQRFFLSWAQVWRANTRDEELARRIKIDPHSPNIFRCNGPLSNMTEFYQAFNIKEGDKLWKADSLRAKVW